MPQQYMKLTKNLNPKGHGRDQTNVNVSSLKYQGEIFGNFFVKPRKKDEIWLELKNLLSILPTPLETKPGKKLNEDILVNVYKHFSHCRKNNLQRNYFSFYDDRVFGLKSEIVC